MERVSADMVSCASFWLIPTRDGADASLESGLKGTNTLQRFPESTYLLI